MQEWSEEQLRLAAELYGQAIGEGRTPKEALGKVMRFAVGEPPAGACEHRDVRYGCPSCVTAVRSRYKEFPLQSTRGLTGPTSVPWAVAEKAWAAYSAQYGREQSVERLAQRGGFSWGEMDELFPGWRDATDAWKKLEARAAELEAQNAIYEKATDTLTRLQERSNAKIADMEGAYSELESDAAQLREALDEVKEVLQAIKHRGGDEEGIRRIIRADFDRQTYLSVGRAVARWVVEGDVASESAS
jgi:hypothetical protein